MVVAGGVALAADITCPTDGSPCIGTNKADTMTGTSKRDDMRGLGGADTIDARGGGDRLSGDAGNDSLGGGDGDDSYVFGGSWGEDNITTYETSGAYTLVFCSLLVEPLDVDLVSRADRDEVFSVFSGAGMLNFPATVEIENVKGGQARDVVRGNEASNRFFGNGGNDSLYGRGGNDVLAGGLGADAFNGGPGDDRLEGGVDTDSDVYMFQDGWGHDSVADAAGTDRLFFGELTTSVTVDLVSGGAYETGFGSFELSPNRVSWTPGAIDNATGGTANDVLSGDDSGNTLNGQGGDDTISGRGGIDTVSGDAAGLSTLTGNDIIDVADGDAGDTVDCGPGTDTVDVDAVQDPVTGMITRIDSADDTDCEVVNEIVIS